MAFLITLIFLAKVEETLEIADNNNKNTKVDNKLVVAVVVLIIDLITFLVVKTVADIVAFTNLFIFLIDDAVLEAVDDTVFNMPLVIILFTTEEHIKVNK